MQVSVETTEGLGRRMKVALPADRLESEVKNRLKNMAPRVKISGFRPGKVPFQIVEQRFGGQVRQEVLGDLLSSTFYEAVAQEKLRPAGMPKIERAKDASADKIEYTATFEVYPEVQIKGIETIRVERPKAEVSEQDIDNMVEKLRKQNTDWRDVERAAKADDRVVLDYHATINGEDFQGGQGTDLKVVIGSKSMIEGFEDALIGTSAGKRLEIDLKFPESYGNHEIAGKPAHFVLEIQRIEEPGLPEINDEFASSFGIQEGGMQALREDIRKNMQRELTRAQKSQVKSQIMEGLLEKIKFDVPKAMIEEESQRYVQQIMDQYKLQGAAKGQLDPAMYHDQARNRVVLGLILAEIIRQNSIKASPDKVRQEIVNIASTYQDPEQVVKWYYSNRDRLSEVESMVLEDDVVEWVLERAQVTDIIKSFDELANPAK